MLQLFKEPFACLVDCKSISLFLCSAVLNTHAHARTHNRSWRQPMMYGMVYFSAGIEVMGWRGDASSLFVWCRMRW